MHTFFREVCNLKKKDRISCVIKDFRSFVTLLLTAYTEKFSLFILEHFNSNEEWM